MAQWRGTIWPSPEGTSVQVLNQILLPHKVEILDLHTVNDACRAIADMVVRGAGLIGNTAAYGMWLAARERAHLEPKQFLAAIHEAGASLKATRPTASNLAWAVDTMLVALAGLGPNPSVDAAVNLLRTRADELAFSESEACRRIGEHGKVLIEEMAARRECVVNILTHCNAGKLAFADYGSALAPVYAAHEAGIPVHVWVDETRPRNQGAHLTAWELAQHSIPHSLITDNAGGHLMQHGQVDMIFVGADRVSRQGDAANKIGTYLKALAAHDNNVPFYVALPCSTFDLSICDGVKEILIEERGNEEVRFMSGMTAAGHLETVRICPEETPARNWAFDVTPARLITGFICERGVCQASEEAIMGLLQ